MKVGDLVRVHYELSGYDKNNYSQCGLVLEIYDYCSNSLTQSDIVILWWDAAIERFWSRHLEVVSECG